MHIYFGTGAYPPAARDISPAWKKPLNGKSADVFLKFKGDSPNKGSTVVLSDGRATELIRDSVELTRQDIGRLALARMYIEEILEQRGQINNRTMPIPEALAIQEAIDALANVVPQQEKLQQDLDNLRHFSEKREWARVKIIVIRTRQSLNAARTWVRFMEGEGYTTVLPHMTALAAAIARDEDDAS